MNERSGKHCVLFFLASALRRIDTCLTPYYPTYTLNCISSFGGFMIPLPDTELLAPPAKRYRIELEPVVNGLNSLLLINQAAEISGLHAWIHATADRLGPEGLHRNRLVLEGLHYAVMPVRRFPSFPAYLEYLTACDPGVLRDQLLEALWSYPRSEQVPDTVAYPAHPAALLASVDVYLSFLQSFFGSACDLELEAEAYELLQDPPRMVAVITGHLRRMWYEYLEPEWTRVRPLLIEAIDAFRHVSLEHLPPIEALAQVARRTPDEKMIAKVQGAERIVFVPSAHIGPYIGRLGFPIQPYIIFGAHAPEGQRAAPGSALNRSELLVRLGTLSDDTRLRVLALLVEHEELCAQELIDRLDTSQSAVSRHVRQLVATGYVIERWRDGSKCYRLNHQSINDLLQVLAQFFAHISRA